jgi:hypothetical protein
MDEPDPIWKLTVFNRSMVDFDGLLASEKHGPFFRSIETIQGMLKERQRLGRVMNIAYLVSFLGACIVLSGSVLTSAKISVLGVEAPLSLLPAQVIAVLIASVYGFFATQFASYLVLSHMIQRVLAKEGWPSWQFFEARFDATALWAVLTTPKVIGYRSPKRVIVLSVAIFLLSAMMVAAHGMVVLISAISAMMSAWHSGSVVLIALGFASVATTCLSLIGLVAMSLLPVPFRWTPNPQLDAVIRTKEETKDHAD